MIEHKIPVISVIVVVYNGCNTITPCINSILNQKFNYPYEIIIVDGMSDDGTREIISSFESAQIPVRIYDNPKRNVSSGRNIGWRNSSASYVAFTDADCIAPSDWLQKLYPAIIDYEKKNLNPVAVGGGNYPPDTYYFYRLLKLLFQSPLGNRKSAQTEQYALNRQVNHLPTCNILYNRNAIQNVNGFDEICFSSAGEDEDLNCRLTKVGFNLFFIADCAVIHYQRNSFRSWISNMHLYGYSRFKLMKVHKELRNPKDLLVLLLPIAICSLIFTAQSCFAAIPFVFYITIIVLHSLFISIRNKKVTYVFQMMALFFVTHFFYASGLIRGIVKLVFNRRVWSTKI